MIDPVDEGLKRLRTAGPGHNLTGLETAVWHRIDTQTGSDVFRGRAFQIQLAVSCTALVVGLMVAQVLGRPMQIRPFRSETAVLSDDSDLAPSIRLAGGV